MTHPLTLILAQPRGFCAGVVRAIEIVENALKIHGAPVYVRHEIVHNKWVIDDLKAKGAVFVKELDEIPAGGVTVFSAHGVAEKVEKEAKRLKLPAVDATCPLVTKVHNQAKRYEKHGHTLLLVGHEGHPEVIGTMGRVSQPMQLVPDVATAERITFAPGTPLAYVTQTTLSVDDTRGIIETLRRRFPQIEGPDMKDICYATQNRQNAVKSLAEEVDLILVIGAENSSNSNRLRDLGEEMGVVSYLINDASECQKSWVMDQQVRRIGITAGASAPELLIEQLVAQISDWRESQIEFQAGEAETMTFNLPRAVRC